MTQNLHENGKKNNPKMDKEFFTSTKNYKDLISGVKVSDLMKKYKLNKYDLNSYLPIQSQDLTNQKLNFIF